MQKPDLESLLEAPKSAINDIFAGNQFFAGGLGLAALGVDLEEIDGVDRGPQHRLAAGEADRQRRPLLLHVALEVLVVLVAL
mgnify:CR=1 FL=1